MGKIIRNILICLLAICALVAYIFWDSQYYSPSNFKVTYLDAESQSVPEDLDGVRVLYFTDLDYGTLFTEEYLDKLSESISQLDYDIIVFGGDVFSDDYSPVSQDVEILTRFFKSLNANLGKFYVLGDHDTISDTRAILVKKILGSACFEAITDSTKIYNGSKQFIRFYGVNSGSTPTMSDSNDTYSIAFIHSTENYKSISESIDLVVAGNAHKWQINIGVSDSYGLGKSGRLYQVRSIGLKQYDYRVFNHPEILIINLKTSD